MSKETIKKYILIFTFLLSSIGTSIGHSWYPIECCSDEDCQPVPCWSITETDKGHKYFNIFFSKEKVKASKDAQCHVCINPNTSEPLCMFLPVTG
jgi:hypothetical protein